MDEGTIVLISLAAAGLLFNIWQSWVSGHFQSKCSVDYDSAIKNPV